MSPTTSTLQPNSILLDPVTNEDRLKNNQSLGIDEISVKVVKAVENEIAEPFHVPNI